MKKNTAFFINGGAGRILCAIPAFELYEQENPDDDFIIVIEYGIDFFKGHPTLFKRCYDFAHRNLFRDKLVNMNFVSPEPYQVWEYFNQKASISQAFDLLINKKDLRYLPPPKLVLSNEELFGGIETLNTIKKDNKNKKVVVFQPFGRGSNLTKEQTSPDIYGKSFSIDDTISIVQKLEKKYTVVVMSENAIDFKKICGQDFTQVTNINLRKWFGLINAADYFLGCDSVGQHIAYALSKPATVVLGSTFKENVSYPTCERFDIIDFGENRKMYSPIRMALDEVADSNNESMMRITTEQIDKVVNSVIKNIPK